MNIYFDTEFTGLYKDTELISIGLISEDGKEFYAEIKGIDKKINDEWIKDNVLKNTISYGNAQLTEIVLDEKDFCYGTKEQVKECLQEWLSQFENINLVSDVAHYDMVLFIDLFGNAFDIPDNVCPACYDINQDIMQFLNIDLQEAFDLNREDFLNQYKIEITGQKHNSLYDAKAIKAIYELIHNI